MLRRIPLRRIVAACAVRSQPFRFRPQLIVRAYASAAAANEQGATERLEFQAETKNLLDIVANSLYSEKEVCEIDNYF